MDEQNVRTSVIEWMGREGLRIIPGLIGDSVLIGATFLFIEVENFKGERGFVKWEMEKENEF